MRKCQNEGSVLHQLHWLIVSLEGAQKHGFQFYATTLETSSTSCLQNLIVIAKLVAKPSAFNCIKIMYRRNYLAFKHLPMEKCFIIKTNLEKRTPPYLCDEVRVMYAFERLLLIKITKVSFSKLTEAKWLGVKGLKSQLKI